MSGSSSTASGDSRLGNQPRLVECPECAIREIRIRSKQPTTYDQVFYKCPNNMRVRIACTLLPIWVVGLMLGFWFGQGYPSTVDSLGQKSNTRGMWVGWMQCKLTAMVSAMQRVSELKKHAGDMQQQIERALGEI